MMLLERNKHTKTGITWLIIPVFICIAGIIAFGARDSIREELRQFMAPNKAEVEAIVKEFIENNPRVIISSVQEMQKRENEERSKQAQIKIKSKKDELEGKGTGINLVAGNKNGDVVVTTFLDYRCGYCKTSNSSLKALIKKDKNVKVIFKELPVLGGASQKLAKTALAVYLLDANKYMDFHNAVMDSRDTSDKAVDAVLKKIGLDKVKVEALMQDTRVQRELDSVANLAGQLGIRGTPAFIINEELFPGAMETNAIIEKVNQVRESKKEK